MASTSLSGLSASVTRILSLTGFPKELKTKDIQNAFSEWEGLAGGFKIKWRDDTSLLIVFQDASVAKRAYLTTIANPPAAFTSSVGLSAVIRPYDGPDAQSVIQNVNSRGQGHHGNASRSTNRGGSISVVTSGSHGRAQSMASGNNGNGYRSGNNSAGPHTQMSSSGSGGSIPEYPSQHANNLPVHHSNNGREPSPTLPSLPSHPTLNALISSSLGEGVTGTQEFDGSADATGGQSGPRIGDPGKRIIGAALGVRHPGLPPRMVNGGGDMPQMHRAMAGLTVAEH